MLSLEGWKVGRIAGIEIRIDATWTFILFLVGYSFFVLLEQRFADSSTSLVAGLAAAMSLVFFASLLIHELAHAVVAQSRGIEVKGITLFLFGGATHAKMEAHQPRDEFIIAAVGPITSVMIAGALWATVAFLGDVLTDEVAYAIGRLGWLNLALGVFNLVPGFPLDGGRLLRALVWERTGDLLRATRVASQAGQVFAHSLIALGVIEVLFGAFVSGLWLAAIGWFLNQAAQLSYSQLEMRRYFRGIEAADVTTREVIDIPADTSLQRAVDDYFMRYDHNAFPVRDNGRTIGILALRAIRKVPNDAWSIRTVREVMEPLSRECSVALHERMDLVVDKLETADSQRVLVLDGDRVVGLITPRDLTRWLRRAQELDLPPPPE
jgi:Zn-dependent protease/predicted transcriptional regulator